MRSYILAALTGLHLVSARVIGSAVPVGASIRSCTQPDTIAITFDDGPFAYTEPLLDQLLEAGIKATFFVNGQNWDSIYNYNSTILRMITEGHQIASHTYSHPDLATLNDTAVAADVTKLEDALVNIIGKYPTYFRAPYFSYNNATLRVLGQLGYHVIDAGIDTLDWQHNTNETFRNAVTNFEEGLANGGSIALMHDVHQNTVERIVPAVIKDVLASGKRAVTVGECLGDRRANWYNCPRL